MPIWESADRQWNRKQAQQYLAENPHAQIWCKDWACYGADFDESDLWEGEGEDWIAINDSDLKD